MIVIQQLIFTKFSMNFPSCDLGNFYFTIKCSWLLGFEEATKPCMEWFLFLNLQNEIFSYCAASGGELHPDWLESPVPESS